jgi:predicted regulator of Ras-like GTPase activity (Roadblock/LC7/MglB family)
MKIKMLGCVESFLRKWLARSKENQPTPDVSAPPAPERRPVMTPLQECTPMPGNGTHQNGQRIELPLQSILSNLALELRSRLKHSDSGALTISVALEKILPQLSRGVVKVSFGELRQAAPDLFTDEDDRDSVLVPLPLREILSRLHPALITRGRMQKQVEIPVEISSPFDPRSPGRIFSVGSTKSELAPPSLPRQVASPAPSLVTHPLRSGMTFAPTPPPPAAASMPLETSVLSAARSLPREPSTNKPPVPAAPAQPTPEFATNSAPLIVNLTSLAEGWPEAVCHELVKLRLVDAKVGLPAEVVERALKQGRVAFTWKTLRSWIRPAPLPVVSAHDSLILELPLKLVAPAFLARQKAAGKLQKRVVVDDEIPNLFFGFPKPESTSPVTGVAANTPPPKQAETNFYNWADTSDRLQLQQDEPQYIPSPGTKFVVKYATPNEVVSRAAALEGVTGALIALPDGLMVASRLRAGLNGETLAAFLPQIFGKVNQCTKELRMGELNNLNFTVGNIPWKIFRVNSIFFAAFGRVGNPLPTSELAALAAELDHTPK